MEEIVKIMRKSISTFLKHIQYFNTTPVLLMLPFSASVLLSRFLFSSSEIWFFQESKFIVSSSKILKLFINQKFSQTFFTSIFIIPFALFSLLISKASIIQALNNHKFLPPPFSSCLSLYKPLLQTHLCSMVLIISINTAAIFLLVLISFSSFPAYGFSHAICQTVCGLFFYAFLTNIIVLCNFALVVAGMENCSGFTAIYKANYLLRKGRNSMALFLAFPTNLGLASIEALFCFRLVKAYQLVEKPSLSMAMEGILIAYLYSLVTVIDTIAFSLFFKSCRFDSSTEHANGFCNRIELV